MKNVRIKTALLALPLAFLVACGSEDSADSTAGSTPTSAPAAAPAAGGTDDKKLCTETKAALQAYITSVAEVYKSGKPPTAEDSKKGLTELSAKLSTVTANGTGKTAETVNALNEEFKKASTSADPDTAMESPTAAKLLTELETLCP